MNRHEPFQFQSLEELVGRIQELGVQLEVSDDISPLLEPVQIDGFRLPNRLVVQPMEGCDGRADGAPDELTFRRYRRFAAGGAGTLWFEATAVTPESRANPRQLWIHEGVVDEFTALVVETLKVARESCGHRPLLLLQLTHSGRYSKPGRKPAPIIAHRSPYLDPLHKLPPDYPIISDEELERLEDRYVEAARCAQRAGFDAVDIKACHRYLISELHASHTRPGGYGGSFENRTRFFRNIVRKIREAVPGLIVTSRMNVYDAMAYPYGFGVDREDPSKPDLTEPIELVRFLKEEGAPLVNITVGNPYYNPHVNRPFDLPTVGAPTPAEHPLYGVARFVRIVGGIQEAFPGWPVIGAGYTWLRQFFPYVAAAAVKRGWVSLIGLGRMAFAYPEFARELAERGRLDPLKVCVACSACTQIMRDGGRTGCVPRDAAVYESIYKEGRAESVDGIQAMARTCLQCNDATCIAHCPTRINIPKFIREIAEGRFRDAYETLRASNVLTTVCGYVCPAETLCESVCIAKHYTQTVPIRHLQRWVSRLAVEEGWAAEPRPPQRREGRRVAVLGAGAAGIAAAATLASLGYKVTLMDRREEPGGVAYETIPPERLPDPVLQREVQDVLASSGEVEQRWRVKLGPGYTLDDLLREGFEGAVLALGLTRSIELPGARRPRFGVIGALEFLARVKRGERVSGAVLVLGAGNTAMDAAVSAMRAGAGDVAVVYRRSFVEMPAWPEERDHAVALGVNFLILTQPLDYVADAAARLTALRVARTRLGPPGPDGRRKPELIPGTEHVLPADLVVEAIGQEVDQELLQALPGVRFERGLVWTREGTFETSRPGVFAAGDLINGGTTVVQAVAEGAQAARELHSWLTHRLVTISI